MKYWTSVFACALLVITERTYADSIPWGYSASSTAIYNNNNAASTSSVTFAGASGIASGSSGIIIYSMATTSGASAASPDSFSNVPFNLAITLTDVTATGSKSADAKASDILHFSGLFSASNVSRQSLLPGASPWSSPVTEQVVLGGDDVGWRTYTVVLSSFTSPGQPGGSPGSIQAIVTIEPVVPVASGENAAVAEAPEPTSLVLAGLGLLPLVAFWRKKSRPGKAQ
jgi:PEP-CTERM motif